MGGGTFGARCYLVTSPRSIPAWAGEPDLECVTSALLNGLSPRGRGNRVELAVVPFAPRVYPRVGGGTCPPSTLLSRRVGLSPRGRGNRHPLPPSGLEVRSIPAWAGEPNCSLYSLYGATVYPRVGGGTDTYPFWYSLAGGLSPRGRGNQLVWGGGKATGRSIPAWAGEPLQ